MSRCDNTLSDVMGRSKEDIRLCFRVFRAMVEQSRRKIAERAYEPLWKRAMHAVTGIIPLFVFALWQ